MVRPAGVLQTGDERLSLRVSGAFDSEQDILDVNFVAGGRMLRLGDIAEVRRGFADPPQPLFRVNGKPAIGLAIAMREGGDILALGDNIAARDGGDHRRPADRHRADAGGRPGASRSTTRSATSPTSLWQAILIILVVSFISARRPRRHGRRALDPADARHRASR